jgi:hypothetical protein
VQDHAFYGGQSRKIIYASYDYPRTELEPRVSVGDCSQEIPFKPTFYRDFSCYKKYTGKGVSTPVVFSPMKRVDLVKRLF